MSHFEPNSSQNRAKFEPNSSQIRAKFEPIRAGFYPDFSPHVTARFRAGRFGEWVGEWGGEGGRGSWVGDGGASARQFGPRIGHSVALFRVRRSFG